MRPPMFKAFHLILYFSLDFCDLCIFFKYIFYVQFIFTSVFIYFHLVILVPFQSVTFDVMST